MSSHEVHLVGGTMAEAARLAPVATAIREQGRVSPVLVAAGPEPLAFCETLAFFGHTPGLAVSAQVDDAALVARLDRIWANRTPGAVVVDGDGSGALAAAMAASWRRIPVVHLDAGRRRGYLGSDAVEEGNRRLLAQVATVHLAAAPLAAMNLLDERVIGGDVLLTGNTGVDAARAARRLLRPWADPELARLRASGSNRLLLVGLEHTESISRELIHVALRQLVACHPDLDVVMLDGEPAGRSSRILGIGSPAYADRARLFAEAYLMLTDTGALQEEALAYGVPSLVLHEVTDTLEPLYAGAARLVGTEPEALFADVSELLASRIRRDSMTAVGNPYGDGLAARRAAQATAALLGHGVFPEPMPAPAPALSS